MNDINKRKERMNRWKMHCEVISKKVKQNEHRRRQSEEYSKYRYSD